MPPGRCKEFAQLLRRKVVVDTEGLKSSLQSAFLIGHAVKWLSILAIICRVFFIDVLSLLVVDIEQCFEKPICIIT